jgi:hypothetical protein
MTDAWLKQLRKFLLLNNIFIEPPLTTLDHSAVVKKNTPLLPSLDLAPAPTPLS